MNASAETLPAGDSELERLGLETELFEGSPVPRIKGCPVAYGCELYEIHEVGPTPQALILGRVNQLYIDDGVVTEDSKGRFKVDAARINPVSRLGASEYMGMGEIITLKRPA